MAQIQQVVSQAQQVAQVQQIPEWVEYVKALGTPLVALIAASVAGVIAYRQWVTARNKLKLDLFDRRMEIYNAAVELVRMPSFPVDRDISRFNELISKVNAARWLLDDDVAAYLQKILDDIHDRDYQRMKGASRTALEIKEDDRAFRHIHTPKLKDVFAPFLKVVH